MDRFRDGSTDWHNWMRDTMQIDQSDSKSIALVWAVISRMKLDAELTSLPPERTCKTCSNSNHCSCSHLDCEHKEDWTPRSPKSTDVETVLKHISNAKKHLEGLHSEREANCEACKVLNSLELSISALDRIAGKLG